MNLRILQKQLVEKSLQSYYIWYGEDIGIMQEYLYQIQKTSEYTVMNCDSVEKAYQMLTRKRIASSPRCIVVRDDKDYISKDSVWDDVMRASSNSKDMLIIIYSKVDKRSKFYKKFNDAMIEFERMAPEILAKYIQKKIDLNNQNAIKLAQIVECDYGRMTQEVHKILSYSRGAPCSPNMAMEILLGNGVIHQSIGDITFKFTDAILTRNYHMAAEYLLQAKTVNEPEILILSVLYNGFKQILMVQGLGNDTKDAVKRTGLTPWQVKMANDKKGYYTINELVHILRVIREVEKGIKTGKIDASIAIEYVIVKIM